MKLSFNKITPGAYLPSGEDNDIHSIIDCIVRREDYAVIRTGIVPLIPPGFRLEIKPRYSLARDHQVLALSGVIHSRSHEEIVVILKNFSLQDYKVREGDPIAQLVLFPVISFLSVLEESEKSVKGNRGA